MVDLSFFYLPDKVGFSGLMVGLSSGHLRDILDWSINYLVLQMKKKSFWFIHYPKASTKPTSEFSCCRLVGFNFKLDFFGRLPFPMGSILLWTLWAIFQKNEHSLVAIEHTIYFPLVMICAKKRAKKDSNHCSWLFCEAFFVQSHY